MWRKVAKQRKKSQICKNKHFSQKIRHTHHETSIMFHVDPTVCTTFINKQINKLESNQNTA